MFSCAALSEDSAGCKIPSFGLELPFRRLSIRSKQEETNEYIKSQMTKIYRYIISGKKYAPATKKVYRILLYKYCKNVIFVALCLIYDKFDLKRDNCMHYAHDRP